MKVTSTESDFLSTLLQQRITTNGFSSKDLPGQKEKTRLNYIFELKSFYFLDLLLFNH